MKQPSVFDISGGFSTFNSLTDRRECWFPMWCDAAQRRWRGGAWTRLESTGFQEPPVKSACSKLHSTAVRKHISFMLACGVFPRMLFSHVILPICLKQHVLAEISVKTWKTGFYFICEFMTGLRLCPNFSQCISLEAQWKCTEWIPFSHYRITVNSWKQPSLSHHEETLGITWSKIWLSKSC